MAERWIAASGGWGVPGR